MYGPNGLHNTVSIAGHNRGDSISSHSRGNNGIPNQTLNTVKLNENLSSAFGHRNGSVSVHDAKSLSQYSRFQNNLDMKSKPMSALGSEYTQSPHRKMMIKTRK